MILKYCAEWGRITAVEVERETEDSVWIGGKRISKAGGYSNYYDTWEEAHADLMDDAAQRVKQAQRRLLQAQSHYAIIQSLEKM